MMERSGGSTNRLLTALGAMVLAAGLLTAHLLGTSVQAATAPVSADAALAQVAGNWLTEPKDGIVQITIGATGALEGRIVGGNHPGKLDEHNPDPTRRALQVRGQVILRDMKYEGAGRWSGGTIYDPNKGSTYKCTVEWLGNGSLKVRGFIGFALLGRTQVWTRYTGTSMDLPASP